MLARAALLALLGVARASDPSSDVDAYLEAIGVPTGLPLLTVKYPRGEWGHKLTIERTAKVLKAPDDVHMKPVVKWDPENADENTKNKFIIAMVGPDHPKRMGRMQSGTLGPLLHWLGVNCEADVKTCYEAVPYEPPKPDASTGVHRYILLLFRQTSPPPMDTLSPFLAGRRDEYPFAEFVSTMSEHMTPIASNFFLASAEGDGVAELDGGEYEPPAADVDAAGAADVASTVWTEPAGGPSPPTASPLGPKWGARPKHEEL